MPAFYSFIALVVGSTNHSLHSVSLSLVTGRRKKISLLNRSLDRSQFSVYLRAMLSSRWDLWERPTCIPKEQNTGNSWESLGRHLFSACIVIRQQMVEQFNAVRRWRNNIVHRIGGIGAHPTCVPRSSLLRMFECFLLILVFISDAKWNVIVYCLLYSIKRFQFNSIKLK